MYREYSENKNIHTILVNDEEIAKKMGLSQIGQVYLFVKSSKFNRKTSNIKIDQLNFQVLPSCRIMDKLIDQINQNSIIYSRDIAIFI